MYSTIVQDVQDSLEYELNDYIKSLTTNPEKLKNADFIINRYMYVVKLIFLLITNRCIIKENLI